MNDRQKLLLEAALNISNSIDSLISTAGLLPGSASDRFVDEKVLRVAHQAARLRTRIHDIIDAVADQ